MSAPVIKVSAFNSVPTIVFRNKSMDNGLTVWVIADPEDFHSALGYLTSLPHIEVVQSGDSHVE